MRHVMRHRTTFLIAHRISSVKAADLVVVLENGRVTQMGTHDELMQQEGHYREIAGAQLQGEEVETEANPSHMKRMRDELHVAEAAAVPVRDESEKV
jgi:ABC-type protease/lipase transport system fused ATPase/permease subunit